ncbi:AsmA family protein [Marinirhabdus gelatinilytica]|uniref:Uncharacterized protein DUF748 n=1 Tax=Marinirhabdus gelatinilytica TaxID=1703343 RepID=A0A370QL90_9FLAO|nr:DUF748 domain-containing protein [Marinirhabdus gelatinilytica]RDK89136.1 uncharacterized protein DUF748 [Marinirhabdus gelatinilytica]
MSKTVRKTLYIFLGIVLLFFIVLISTNIILKNKVENFTKERLPENISATFKDVSLHLLNGTLTYSDVAVTLKNKSNDTAHTYLTADKVIVADLSYWDYLFDNEIHIEDVKLKSPTIRYFKDRLVTTKDSASQKPFMSLKKPLLVDELSINNATVTFFDTSEKDTLLHARNLTVEVDDILVNKTTLNRRLPLEYSNYEANTDSIFLKMSPYENLTVGDVIVKDKKATVSNLHLFTKYSKAEHASMLKKERDHFNVLLDSLEINNIDFGFNNRKFFAQSDFVKFTEIQATIYRNKLVADDPTIKPLYSKMLRDLPIDLTIDSVAITKSTITYQEKVKQEQPAGSVYFDSFNARLSNVSNTYKQGTNTTITVDARFMKSAPIQVDWSFDVNNTQDKFTFKAELTNLPAKQMNPFTKPNLLVAMEGEVNKNYFSIYGNSSQSKIDMQINYDEFKVEILNEKRNKKSGILSGIVNIFVNKDSDSSEDDFKKGSATVTPDRTKSFFNYLWLNIAAALKDCLL